MNTVEYLSQGRRLNEMILFQAERLKAMRACADSVGAAGLSGTKVSVSPSGDAPYVRALHRIWDMQEAVDRELRTMIRLEQQIGQVIGTLLSGDYRMLLRYRYLNRKTWEQIADLMHIDPSTAKRWHAKAVAMLTLPEDAICIRNGEEQSEYAGDTGRTPAA